MGPAGGHQRTEDGLQADQWSYSVPVPAGAIYAARVSLLQARISVPFSGNLTIQLDNNASLAVPVSGVYRGVTYAPAVSHARVIIIITGALHGAGCPSDAWDHCRSFHLQQWSALRAVEERS